MELFEDLQWRGLIKDVTDLQALKERLKTPVTVYCGFDPTADSLHIGHLQQLFLLRRYYLAGHTVIALMGGATGMIGDPRPTSERKLQSLETIEENIKGIAKQFARLLDVNSDRVILENNHNWLSKMDILSFLRDYGKWFNVSYMIAKDTIASRLSSGISFTEFTYTILQAIDWLTLYRNYHCEVQIGGSDQWGNLTSGMELIRKLEGDKVKVYGITSPLIQKSDGTKFGKSEGGNIWLDPKKTSPYEFYQFILNVADADIISLMKRLSFKSREEIEALEVSLNNEPHKREAQKALASELTELLHGKEGLESALRITGALFSGDVMALSFEELSLALADAPKTTVEDGTLLIDALVLTKAATSKREARELIQNGSISVNGTKVQDLAFTIQKQDAHSQKLAIIKKGRRYWFLLNFA